MSLAQTAAQVAAAIQRARVLFSSAPHPVSTAAGQLVTAAQSTRQAGARMGDLSGVMVARHADLVGVSASQLAAAAGTDARLQGYLGTAAQVTQSGAARLDQLLAQARAIAQIAGAVPPGAGQQAVLSALRTLAHQSDQVVDATHQRAAVLASQVRALDYSGEPRAIHKAGFGPDDPDPNIDGPGTPPVMEPNNTKDQDDLDASVPGTGIALGGDGKHGYPNIRLPGGIDGPNPIPHPPDTRPLPTGTAIGPHGERYGFYALVPYHNPDGSKNENYTVPDTVVVDLAHPDKILYTLHGISQASGAYDASTDRMIIMGNDTNGARGLWASAPVAQNGSWGNTLISRGTFGGNLNGDRESQIVALPKGGGFMMVGAANGKPIEGAVAKTPEGLLTAAPRDLVPQLPDGQFPYGPTVTDIREEAGKEIVTMRLSTFGIGDYDPHTYTTTFSVTP